MHTLQTISSKVINAVGYRARTHLQIVALREKLLAVLPRLVDGGPRLVELLQAGADLLARRVRLRSQPLAVVALLEVVVVATVDLGLALLVQLEQALRLQCVLRQLAGLHLVRQVLTPRHLNTAHKPYTCAPAVTFILIRC